MTPQVKVVVGAGRPGGSTGSPRVSPPSAGFVFLVGQALVVVSRLPARVDIGRRLTRRSRSADRPHGAAGADGAGRRASCGTLTLLDSNITIKSDTLSQDVEPDYHLAMTFQRLVAEGGHRALVHPSSRQDAARDPDAVRRAVRLRALGRYPLLQSPPRPGREQVGALGVPPPGSNDAVDQDLLAAVVGTRPNCWSPRTTASTDRRGGSASPTACRRLYTRRRLILVAARGVIESTGVGPTCSTYWRR